jgi:hypothetical protein
MLSESEAVEAARARRARNVLAGRNGRLFLRNDTNDVLAQHLGQRPLSDRVLREWTAVMEERYDRLVGQSIRTCFLVAPDAHAVHADDLPAEHQPATTRPVLELVAHLPPHLASMIVYPLDSLRAHGSPDLYPLTDTHWSERGAYIAYEEALPFLTDAQVGRVAFVPEEGHGDLGWRVHPARTSPVARARLDGPRAVCVGDNEVRGSGSVLTFERSGPGGRLTIFGDSYVWQLLPFACRTFQRVTWVHSGAIDWEAVDEEQPDAVLTEQVERFLVYPPEGTDRGLRERAAKKRADGNLRQRPLFGIDVEELIATDITGRRRPPGYRVPKR